MTRKFRQKTDSANFQQNTAFRRCSGKLVLQYSWNCPRKIPSRVKDQEHSTENVLKTSSFKVVFIKFFKNLLKALIPEPLHTAPTTFKVREIHPLTVFHIKDSANTNPNEQTHLYLVLVWSNQEYCLTQPHCYRTALFSTIVCFLQSKHQICIFYDLYQKPEAVVWRCSMKRVFLKISQNSLGHRCFPANLAKLLKTSIFIGHLRWLLLKNQ